MTHMLWPSQSQDLSHLNTCGRFWDVLDNTLHHQHQNTELGISFWRMLFIPKFRHLDNLWQGHFFFFLPDTYSVIPKIVLILSSTTLYRSDSSVYLHGDLWKIHPPYFPVEICWNVQHVLIGCGRKAHPFRVGMLQGVTHTKCVLQELR